MDNLKIVFPGTSNFTIELPPAAEHGTADARGFEAVCAFRRLKKWRAIGEPAFVYAQAVAVSEVEGCDFRGSDCASVLVSPGAARWVLCFPVRKQQGGKYVLRTNTVPPDGDDVFYAFTFFTTTAPTGVSVRAVPDLDSLKFLSPCPGTKLGVLHAGDWHWNEGRDTVLISPKDNDTLDYAENSV